MKRPFIYLLELSLLTLMEDIEAGDGCDVKEMI